MRSQKEIRGLFIFIAAALFIAACTIRTQRLERRLENATSSTEGEYPDLNRSLFGPRARFTGLLRAERFNRVLGFWIFLRGPHRPERMPVILVHGHTTGPRRLETVANYLDNKRFEPWFCYYATGIELDRSAVLLRQSLSEMADRYDEPRVAIVAYSFGGLVVRQALRPYEDGVEMPDVPLVVNVSVPWSGSRHRRFYRGHTFSPGSWEDLTVGSWFLEHLFDDPLPAETHSHIIYGLGGRDRRSIPGDDDRILSVESLARPEAIREAETVTVLPNVTHYETISDVATLSIIGNLLDEIEPASRQSR